jgi:hypothetical protein
VRRDASDCVGGMRERRCPHQKYAGDSASAASRLSATVRSPETTSTMAGRPADSAFRLNARTRVPARSNSSTTRRPMLPVAPTTSMGSVCDWVLVMTTTVRYTVGLDARPCRWHNLRPRWR